MEKIIRKAVRCYLIEHDKVLVIKYKKGNRKANFYDIPGGKIEEGENPEDTVKREMREETGIEVKKLTYKGNMILEYPDRIYDFDTFICTDYNGEPQEFEENISKWINIKELVEKENILATILILNKFFIKGLTDDKLNFYMHIKVNEDENVTSIEFRFDDKK